MLDINERFHSSTIASYGFSDFCYVYRSTHEGTHSSDDDLVKERKLSTISKHYHSLLKTIKWYNPILLQLHHLGTHISEDALVKEQRCSTSIFPTFKYHQCTQGKMVMGSQLRRQPGGDEV